MPTVDELMNELDENVSVMSVESNEKCIINPETREIEIPETYQILGVESDEKTERIEFQCPKIVGDNIDLTQLQLRVNFQNANMEVDQYIVEDATQNGDDITFSWLLSRKVTAYRGTVQFIVCAVKVYESTITNEWNTTLAESEVLEGLEVEEPEPTGEQSDLIAQLINIIQNNMAVSSNYVQQAQIAKDTAVSASAQAKTYYEQTRDLSVASVGNMTFAIDPVRNCLTVTYDDTTDSAEQEEGGQDADN